MVSSTRHSQLLHCFSSVTSINSKSGFFHVICTLAMYFIVSV